MSAAHSQMLRSHPTWPLAVQDIISLKGTFSAMYRPAPLRSPAQAALTAPRARRETIEVFDSAGAKEAVARTVVSLGSDEIRKALRAHNELAPESEAAKKAAGSLVAQPGDVVFFWCPPPSPPVLTGHAASLTPY